ncbi:MAG: tetratricopeptide repeat protein, partial [Bryobacteraceae bacterium]
QYDKAASDLTEALRIQPDYGEARLVLGKAEAELAHAKPAPALPLAAATTSHPLPVVAPVAKTPPAPIPVAPLAPKPRLQPAASAEQHNLRGRELTRQARYREALAELSEAIRLKPDFALAYNARGFAYQLLRDYTRAIEDFSRAIAINPKYANAYHNRGIVEKLSGDAAAATADLATASALRR